MAAAAWAVSLPSASVSSASLVSGVSLLEGRRRCAGDEGKQPGTPSPGAVQCRAGRVGRRAGKGKEEGCHGRDSQDDEGCEGDNAACSYAVRNNSGQQALRLSVGLAWIRLPPWGRGGGGRGGGGGVDADGSLIRGVAEKVLLASFAVTKAAYERITRAFAAHWLAETGRTVRFRMTFAGSGTQARAVMDGLPADLVALALPLDVMKIAEEGLVAKDWREKLPNKASVGETVVAIVTRAGNPKNIRNWADLARPGLKVITANPKTAGVARWAFLALWGSVTCDNKGDDAAALAYVRAVFDNVTVQPRDAREASDAFYTQGLGDVLLTYENEALLTNAERAKFRAEPLPYLVPEPNVLVETPVALVDRNADKHRVRPVCEAFLKYCFELPAQREFAVAGFRPVHPQAAAEVAAQRPPVRRSWGVEELFESWPQAQRRFFDTGAIVDGIQKEALNRAHARVQAEKQLATA
eukprot:jgi/Chlat1/4486/Chrsp29S04430